MLTFAPPSVSVYIIYACYPTILFHYALPSPSTMKLNRRRRICFIYSVLRTALVGGFLTHNKHVINTCQINEDPRIRKQAFLFVVTFNIQ